MFAIIAQNLPQLFPASATASPARFRPHLGHAIRGCGYKKNLSIRCRAVTFRPTLNFNQRQQHSARSCAARWNRKRE